MNATALRPVIWKSWSALLLASAMALAMFATWRGTEVAGVQQQAEQEAALREIGRSIASGLERAQTLGIPLKEAVGLEPWLAVQTSGSPLVSGLAITMASGELLAQHGVDPVILLSLRRPGAANSEDADSTWVSTPVLGADKAQPVAWLHVVGAPHPRMWVETVFTLGLALLVVVLTALGLRRWLHRHIDEPMERIRKHLTGLATGQLVQGAVSLPEPGRHELALLDRALAERWADLQQRNALLLQKLNEVRAAHFDTSVLSRIDSLAAPLLHAPHAHPGAVSMAPVAFRGWRQWSLNRRITATLLGGWMLTLLALMGLYALHQNRVLNMETAAASQRLQTALDQAMGVDLARLEAWVQPSLAEAVLATDTSIVRAALPSQARWWMRPDQEEALSVGGGDGDELKPPPRSVLEDLTNRRETVRGIWVEADQSLRMGLGRALLLQDSTQVQSVASLPLNSALDQLAKSLGATLALADHRGQPVGGEHTNLVERWQQAQRRAVAPHDKVPVWLLSVPLMSHTGHTLGHLVAELPPDASAPGGSSGSQLPLLMGALWLTLGALIWLVRQQLRPLGAAGQELARIAESPAPGSPDDIRLESLLQDIAGVENRLDVLRALRRSRERQGRRQARFIRHQMLELANRLDDSARADVLQDLERIESASTHPAPVASELAAQDTAVDHRFERMVDEVGVLALGFQNLVGRVGDQYQQLGRLVQELREALRVKTQFIAIQQELEIARKMQLAFLPHDFSHQVGVQLHGVTQPAREVGGDFYDFFRLDEHHLAVLVADVSGKGVPAAFFMAVSRTLMRAVSQFSTGPADCLQRLNDLLAADNDEMMFVTLFYAVMDTRSGDVSYGNAGHNPPYVVRGGGRVDMLPSLGDMALAVMPQMPYTEGSLRLEPGDALFMYTDGVTEASSPEGDWYGEAQLERFLAGQGAMANVQDVNQNLLEAIRQFEAGGAQSDDVTCLMIRFVPSTASTPPTLEHASP